MNFLPPAFKMLTHRLSYKIGLGYFVLILINIAIAAFAVYHINRLGSPIERILENTYRNVSAAENMIKALRQQELEQFDMLQRGIDDQKISNFGTYQNEFLNWHEQAKSNISLAGEPLLLDAIFRAFQAYTAVSDSLQSQLKMKKPAHLIRQFQSQAVFPAVTAVEQGCLDLKALNEKSMREADAEAQRFSRQGSLAIVVISVIAVLFSVIAGIRFTQNIIRPVRQTTETVRKIGSGQLNQKIDITTNDEIAELGREFNKMTERLQAYEEMNINKILREKKRSEAIVAGIPVAIMVTDEQNRLSLLNASARHILNVGSDGWQDRPLGEVVTHSQLRDILLHHPEGASQFSDTQKALVVLPGRETEQYFLCRQIQVTDPGGKRLGNVTLLQDVTSFKMLDRLKSEFMATISHEFKTPLTSMNMAVDILLQEVRGTLNDAQRELLGDAKQDCDRLRNLVRDLLDLSRLESGRQELDFQPHELSAIVAYALQPLRFMVSNKSIDLQLAIPASLPSLYADFHHLARVVTNLVENAVQHTPENGVVEIAAGVAGDVVEVCIADGGPGIPAEAIDLIFDKFVQVKQFQHAERGNIGLGLAISREIIAAHGGDIRAESMPGEGSRFYFRVPCSHVATS